MSCLLLLLISPVALAITTDQDYVAAKGMIDFPTAGQATVELFSQYGGDEKDVCFTLTNTGEKTIGVYFNGNTNDGKNYSEKSAGLKETGREISRATSVFLCFNRIRSIEIQCPTKKEIISEEPTSAEPFPQLDLLGCQLQWEVSNLWKNLY
jgi:hypothetical protein